MKQQFAVYEKNPAHSSKENPVILAPFNTKDQAIQAMIKWGYNNDNYYVDNYPVKTIKDQNLENIHKLIQEFRNWNNEWNQYSGIQHSKIFSNMQLTKHPKNIDEFVEELSQKYNVIQTINNPDITKP
jgi:hypothetical protein